MSFGTMIHPMGYSITIDDPVTGITKSLSIPEDLESVGLIIQNAIHMEKGGEMEVVLDTDAVLTANMVFQNVMDLRHCFQLYQSFADYIDNRVCDDLAPVLEDMCLWALARKGVQNISDNALNVLYALYAYCKIRPDCKMHLNPKPQ